MTQKYLKLGEILVKEGLITKENLTRAVELQQKSSEEFLGNLLIKMGAVTEKDLKLALSKQLEIPYASRDSGLLTPSSEEDLTRIIPEDFARRHRVLPLHRHLNSLTLAMADPTDLVLLDNIKKMTGCEIQRLIANASDIDEMISRYYGEGGMLRSAVAASHRDPGEDYGHEPKTGGIQLSLDSVVQSAEETPVVKMTDLLIRQAIKERASDIHLEPMANAISIRFRIDGVLKEIPSPNKAMFLPLVSRLKILSKMDIAEKRLPQDGGFNASIEGRLIDFRVSTIPTVHGEKMVLRILDRSSVELNLSKLGFETKDLEIFKQVIHKPYGLILMTGPTGSGKTTTLYSALSELNTKAKNIITIEDPVEYKMNGINQVQVKPQIGLSFAAGLRSFLRQDPDVMLVGETRDAETAQICVRAALTGHLVFSTLHTNDAPSSINRLIDIGVEPFFVSSSLLLVVAQRLVRRLCPKCKESYTPSATELPKNFTWSKEKLFRAKGCVHCMDTGYLGREAIYELMHINDSIQKLIVGRATTAEIRVQARKNGMQTLEESGFKKVLKGETSLDEVLRVTLSDEH